MEIQRSARNPEPATERLAADAEAISQAPRTIAIQPRPLDVMVDRFVVGDTGEVISAINRGWADGDSGPGGRCTRCFTCIARPNNRCQMLVNLDISEADGRDFSPRALGLGVDAR